MTLARARSEFVDQTKDFGSNCFREEVVDDGPKAGNRVHAKCTLDDSLTSTNKCGRRSTALARIGMLIEVSIEERGLDGDQPHDLPTGSTSRRLLRRRSAL